MHSWWKKCKHEVWSSGLHDTISSTLNSSMQMGHSFHSSSMLCSAVSAVSYDKECLIASCSWSTTALLLLLLLSSFSLSDGGGLAKCSKECVHTSSCDRILCGDWLILTCVTSAEQSANVWVTVCVETQTLDPNSVITNCRSIVQQTTTTTLQHHIPY